MNDNSRHALITSFLALPQSKVEHEWLADSVRSAKETALENMCAAEITGASGFNAAHEDISRDSESSYFHDFHVQKRNFENWLCIEAEIYLSIGFEHCFDIDQAKKIEARVRGGGYQLPADSLLLTKIANNLMYHVAHRTSLVRNGRRKIECAQQKIDEYAFAYADNFDDEYDDELQGVLDNAEEELKQLKNVLPFCWASLQEFVELSRPGIFVPGNLSKFVNENDCENFIKGYQTKQTTSRATVLRESAEVREDDDSFCDEYESSNLDYDVDDDADHLFEELLDDQDSWARSDEDGWYHDDED